MKSIVVERGRPFFHVTVSHLLILGHDEEDSVKSFPNLSIIVFEINTQDSLIQ